MSQISFLTSKRNIVWNKILLEGKVGYLSKIAAMKIIHVDLLIYLKMTQTKNKTVSCLGTGLPSGWRTALSAAHSVQEDSVLVNSISSLISNTFLKYSTNSVSFCTSFTSLRRAKNGQLMLPKIVNHFRKNPVLLHPDQGTDFAGRGTVFDQGRNCFWLVD